MKNFVCSTFSIFGWCAITFVLIGSAFAQPQSPLPAPTGMVNDYADVIEPSLEAQIERKLRRLRDVTNPRIEIAVVTVPTINGQDPFDYSLAVSRGWGIGSKDDDNPSLLVLAAINDRKYFTQISRDAEGDIPDSVAGQIQRERLVPAFRAGQYGAGLNNTVDAYITRFAEQRGFDANSIIGVQQAQQPPERQTGRRARPAQASLLGCCVIGGILLFVLFSLFGGGRGGRRGGGYGGGGFGGGLLNGILLSMLLNSASRGSDSGWSGGSFGGSGGGFGGDSGGGFGGFGGGGDFGGGGAGGDW